MCRVYPFGYEMIKGNIVINQIESEIVENIFTRYFNDESYAKIAKILGEQGVPYHENKTEWNKNMIARIILNGKYLGNEKYPPIVTQQTYDSANQKKEQKTNRSDSKSDTTDIRKMLICAKCGESVQRKIDGRKVVRWYCPNEITHISSKITDNDIVNSVIMEIKQYQLSNYQSESSDNLYIENLEREIDLLLRTNVQVEQSRELITILANAKYENCSGGMTDRKYKEDILKQIQSSENIDYILLKQIVKNIKLTYDGEIIIVERS